MQLFTSANVSRTLFQKPLVTGQFSFEKNENHLVLQL